MTNLLVKLWTPILVMLGITGMGQMPIFKRYYVADIPGLDWLGEPYIVHWVHYAAAAVFIFLAAWFVTVWIAERSEITATGWIRMMLLALLIATGYVRVIKNLPDVHFSPLVTMLIDWTHLFFAFLFGVVALWSVITGRRHYVRRKL